MLLAQQLIDASKDGGAAFLAFAIMVFLFAGSLFFTAAGFLSYREAVDAAPRGSGATGRRFFVVQRHRIDWWATAIQLAGTLFFNISCGYALQQNLTALAAHRHVWRPDAFGSICFLVASALAWFEVCHGWGAWRPRQWAWWITLVNLAGSVAFGASIAGGASSSARTLARMNFMWRPISR